MVEQEMKGAGKTWREQNDKKMFISSTFVYNFQQRYKHVDLAKSSNIKTSQNDSAVFQTQIDADYVIFL